MRIHSSDIFVSNPNGSVSPKVTVQIGGVTLGPGVSFNAGVSFSGVDVTKLIGKDLEVDVVNNVYIIKGIYS